MEKVSMDPSLIVPKWNNISKSFRSVWDFLQGINEHPNEKKYSIKFILFFY
jgi:hypothetical protein